MIMVVMATIIRNRIPAGITGSESLPFELNRAHAKRRRNFCVKGNKDEASTKAITVAILVLNNLL